MTLISSYASTLHEILISNRVLSAEYVLPLILRAGIFVTRQTNKGFFALTLMSNIFRRKLRKADIAT
jgi:hypothetical protein